VIFELVREPYLETVREATPALQRELARLVEELGDADYFSRDGATRRLIEIGAPAFEFLRDFETNDLEIAWRVEEVRNHWRWIAERVDTDSGYTGVPALDR
jgi:hypothetical protein